MAMFERIRGEDDIINGSVVVATPHGSQTYDPSYSQHFPSGTDPTLFTVLDGRFNVDPSGWSS